MSEKESFPVLDVSPALFESASFGNLESIVDITGKINLANSSRASWPEEIRKLFEEGLNKAVEHFDVLNLKEVELNLLKAAREAALGAPILRDKYAALAKIDFPKYQDPAALCDFLGIRAANVPMAEVNKRWAMLRQVKPNAVCFDKTLAMGRVFALDDITSEIIIQFDKRRSIPLKAFFAEYIIVADLSPLHSIIITRQLPIHRDGDNLRERLNASLLYTATFPGDLLRQILVPAIMNESHYKTQVLNEPVATKQVTEVKKTVEGKEVTDIRWDESRTVLELSERLKLVSTLNLANEPNKGNVLRIFQLAATRPDQAERFALAMAYLVSLADEEMTEWIGEMARTLAQTAILWEKPELCAEISDKMPGKLALDWFKATALACGDEYLAKTIVKVPHRLWGHAEKVFAERKTTDILNSTVIADLAAGHVSADLLFWVWKSKSPAIKPLKDKYLGNADYLFKTLQRPVKGNYLKAQRDMKKLLMSDLDFQEQAMRYGDKAAVQELLRCTKRMPLLSPGEKQSLLVQISEIYPQYLSDIEEKQSTPKFAAIENITSTRSYKARVAELENLINVLIPENTQAIAHARSLGDLRENSEFKFAKERQAYLNRRRREWEESLASLSQTDFANVQVGKVVIPGSTVTIEYLDDDYKPTGETESYCILGVLDFEPEKKIISFNSPLGKILMGKEVKASVTMPNGKQAVITAIKPLSPEMKKYVAGEE